VKSEVMVENIQPPLISVDSGNITHSQLCTRWSPNIEFVSCYGGKAI